MEQPDKIVDLVHEQVERLLLDFRNLLDEVGRSGPPEPFDPLGASDTVTRKPSPSGPSERLQHVVRLIRSRLKLLPDSSSEAWGRFAGATPEGMPVAPFGRESASWHSGVVDIAENIDDALPDNEDAITSRDVNSVRVLLPAATGSVRQAEIYTTREWGRARWAATDASAADDAPPRDPLEHVYRDLTPDTERFLRRLASRTGQWRELGSLHSEFWPDALFEARRVHDLKRRTVARLRDSGHGEIADRIEGQRDFGYRLKPLS